MDMFQLTNIHKLMINNKFCPRTANSLFDSGSELVCYNMQNQNISIESLRTHDLIYTLPKSYSYFILQ